MKKIKQTVLLVIAVLMVNAGFAQTVEQGKQFIYYEKFKSAKETLEKIVAANPSNDEAAYYLGQAYIGLENYPGAREVYVKALNANPNSALLIAGMGHVELLEGKQADARNRFETAISLSKGKSIPVLNAVGFANANPDSKNGDAAYAIDKLTQATKIKGFKDPEVLTNLGDAYRKFADGTNAVLNYQAALAINPNYARALYRIGKVYQTQGVAQEDIFMKYYNDAIAKDPAYAPVYANLYTYFYNTNVTRSADYLQKWLQYSDDDPRACYYQASMKYAQGLFNDAIVMADKCIAEGGTSPYPNLYGIKALAFNRVNDTINAIKSFEEYFKRQNPDLVLPGDYGNYAGILINVPGREAEAEALIEKALKNDSIEANRVAYVRSLAKAYEDGGKNALAAKWYARLVKEKRNPSNVDLFNAGYNYYLADNMDSSNVFFEQYATRYPDDIMGHYMLGNAYSVIDSTGQGLAVPHYERTIEIALSDTTKPAAKTRLLTAYRYFINYHYNVMKDQAMALSFVDKALALSPEDEQLITYREYIVNNDPKATRRSSSNK